MAETHDSSAAEGAAAPRPIRVFLLDDHEIVRRGIKELLEAEGDIEVVGEAGLAQDALNRIPAVPRRKTLIARKEAGAVPRYVLDIRLQGENETVFFDL